MPMSKKANKRTAVEPALLIITAGIGYAETGALVCDVFLLCMFFYNQIFHGLNMWFVIVPLLIIGLYLTFFGIIPEKYHFTDNSIEVWQLGRKSAAVSYESVFDYEATVRDNFINLLQENKVKIYYTSGKTKKMTICKPHNVHIFVEELKKRCIQLSKDTHDGNLKVFFKNKTDRIK